MSLNASHFESRPDATESALSSQPPPPPYTHATGFPDDVDMAASLSHMHPAPVPVAAPYVSPLKKLTVHLIRTYREVNERYYERKARKKRDAEEAAKRTAPRQRFNNGWDDENYDLLIQVPDQLGEHYRMVSVLGRGSFGQVVKAEDCRTQQAVAVKIIKSKKPFFDQARTEMSVLAYLNQRDPTDQCNIVRMLDQFVYRNHQCIVFELLSYNLYDLLKDTRFHGVSLNLIRKFARQLLLILDVLLPMGDDATQPGVIHCDLKPENILLRNPKRSAIKVIDFGSSCFTNDRMYTYIQSRFYRAPEVLFGLSYSHPIDMWSLGCILVELHTGEPIFSGADEFDQVCQQVAVLGFPPAHVLESGRKVKNYFHLVDGQWALQERRNSRGETVVVRRRSLREILGVETSGPFGRRRDEKTGHSVTDYLRFEELIRRMLDWSADTRLTPAEAVQHPFFKATQEVSTLTDISQPISLANSHLPYFPADSLPAAHSLSHSHSLSQSHSQSPYAPYLPYAPSAAASLPLAPATSVSGYRASSGSAGYSESSGSGSLSGALPLASSTSSTSTTSLHLHAAVASWLYALPAFQSLSPAAQLALAAHLQALAAAHSHSSGHSSGGHSYGQGHAAHVSLSSAQAAIVARFRLEFEALQAQAHRGSGSFPDA